MEFVVGWYILNVIFTVLLGRWIYNTDGHLKVKDIVILIVLLFIPISGLMLMVVAIESNWGDKVLIKKKKETA